MQESTYVASLDAQAKRRYLENLSCVGLLMSDDPYLSCNDRKYVNDMTTWPCIEYGHIFEYFVRRPGVYTQEELLSWKEMNAYNLCKWARDGCILPSVWAGQEDGFA